jgi:hypothetical protein
MGVGSQAYVVLHLSGGMSSSYSGLSFNLVAGAYHIISLIGIGGRMVTLPF